MTAKKRLRTSPNEKLTNRWRKERYSSLRRNIYILNCWPCFNVCHPYYFQSCTRCRGSFSAYQDQAITFAGIYLFKYQQLRKALTRHCRFDRRGAGIFIFAPAWHSCCKMNRSAPCAFAQNQIAELEALVLKRHKAAATLFTSGKILTMMILSIQWNNIGDYPSLAILAGVVVLLY